MARRCLVVSGALSLLVPASLRAQGRTPDVPDPPFPPEESEAPALTEPKAYRHMLLATGAFDTEDFFLGATYRYTLSPPLDLGLGVFTSFRLTNKHVVDQVRTHFFVQREENVRGLVGMTLDKVQMFTEEFGAYLGVGGAYSAGDYVGTNVEPDSGWTFVLDAGLTLRFRPRSARGVIRGGYRYADRFTGEENMAFVAAGVDL